MNRRKKIPFVNLFRRRHTLIKYFKREPNGCLIYIGPMKGRQPGNVKIRLNGGKTTTSLRPQI